MSKPSRSGKTFGRALLPGQLADALYAAREERYALQHRITKMEKEESELKDKLRAALLKLKGQTVGGRVARVTLKVKQVPRAVNWDATWKHIQKTGEFDLLHKRLNEEAVRARWDAKQSVPGVQAESVSTLSVEKL